MITLVVLLLAADPAAHLTGIDGAFVWKPAGESARILGSVRHGMSRFPPCSTFKIPNAAIALETGVAPDANFRLPIRPEDLAAIERTEKSLNADLSGWKKDQTLASAYQVSALWYFQELARRIGRDHYEEFLAAFRYGNQDASGPVDRFWLGEPLEITPVEQVEFLERLTLGRLGLKPRTTELMKQIMIADQQPNFTIRAKSGACGDEGKQVSLWYVGSVERAGKFSYFALHFTDKTYAPLMSQRVPKARAILKDLGAID
jgi:beta-lactamase class D